ncbi:ComEC/Rec2 family competence protein [Curvivirga sp.]|uniref:ComEC/Rec2 family competence protein n=1 Tax=Curvivirga sp. TaxID=2856848 RepID=UPI003B5B62EB
MLQANKYITDILDFRMFSSLHEHVSNVITIEINRVSLWRPVFLGIGILLYFNANLSGDLGWKSILVIFPVILLIYLTYKKSHSLLRLGLSSILLIIIGFLLTEFRSYMVAAPVVQKQIKHVSIQGNIQNIELYENKYRLIIADIVSEEFISNQTPHKIRVSIPSSHMENDLQIGDRISLKVSLRPPPNPSTPGSYDFARAMWFKGIGGIGYSTSKITLLEHQRNQGLWDVFTSKLTGFRYYVTQQFLKPSQFQNSNLPGVRAALVTGERSQITSHTYDVIRDAGLAHLLAISGLHLGLIAVLVFGGLRLLWSCIPLIVLNFNTKKYAAICAIFVCFGYMLLSGLTIPSQRAFLMLSVAFLGVVLDRNVISLRLVSFAALIVLLIHPEAILTASFQLSFAAVIGLVSVYEVSYMKDLYTYLQQNYFKRMMGYFLFLCITTIIATLATAPLSTYHFGQLASYGILSNLIAVPLMGMIVMPSALMAFILMPFGLEAVGLYGMDFGLSIILEIAIWVSQLEGAVIHISRYNPAILTIIIVSCLWLCLWKSIIRFLAIPFAIFSSLILYLPIDKEILISSQEQLFGVYLNGSDAYITTSNRHQFIKDQWKDRWAIDEFQPLSALGKKIEYILIGFNEDICTKNGCRLFLDDHLVFYTISKSNALEACDIPNSIVIYPVGFINCDDKDVIVIDRGDIIRNGGYKISSVNGELDIQSVLEDRSNYPWQLVRNKKGSS